MMRMRFIMHLPPLERSEQRAESDNRGEGDDGPDNADDDDITITFAMGRSTDGEQCDHRAVVRKAIERSGAYHRYAMQQSGSQPNVRRTLHVGSRKHVESDGQSTGCRTSASG